MSHGLNLQYVSSRVIQSYYRFIDVKAQVQTTFVGFSSFRRLLLFSGTSVGTLPTLESLQILAYTVRCEERPEVHYKYAVKNAIDALLQFSAPSCGTPRPEDAARRAGC